MSVLLCFQGFHRSCCGLVCGVARRRHEPASRAAYLIWRCMHVPRACVPPVSTQDSGEFCSDSSSDSSQGCIIILFRNMLGALSHDLSVVCFAETLDIIWPCAPIILRISKSASLQ